MTVTATALDIAKDEIVALCNPDTGTLWKMGTVVFVYPDEFLVSAHDAETMLRFHRDGSAHTAYARLRKATTDEIEMHRIAQSIHAAITRHLTGSGPLGQASLRSAARALGVWSGSSEPTA